MTTEIYHKICAYLRRLIEGTEWEGHVFTVGGCLRDQQLGHEIKDVDLAVDLPGGGVAFAEWLWKKRLACFHPVEFKRYGTAMTRLKAFPHDDIEIVQTRAEKYTDRNSRNPDTAFGSIEDDCYRRDLTINSLYYDISRDKILDITGRGIQDLQNHVIATPTDPDATYDDDPVRILRTIRFATRLDWQIPSHIMEAMKRNVGRMDIIKVERLRGEFEKMLLGPRPGRALELMRMSGALYQLIPELEDLTELPLTEEHGTVWEHTLRTVNAIQEPDLALRMAALLHDIGKKACFTTDAEGRPKYPRHELRAQVPIMIILGRLKYHSPFIKEVAFLARYHTAARKWGSEGEKISDKDLRHLQYHSASPSRLRALVKLIHAVNNAHGRELSMPLQARAILRRDEEMRTQGTAMYDYHLPFGESRIKRLKGIGPGPQVADCIGFMMKHAYADPTLTRKDFENLLLPFVPKHTAADPSRQYATSVQPMPEALVPLPGARRGATREYGVPDPETRRKKRAADRQAARNRGVADGSQPNTSNEPRPDSKGSSKKKKHVGQHHRRHRTTKK